MQGLRRFDLDLFIFEADKPQMNSDRDHMSVFSDPDSIPAEEGKEARSRKRNLEAAFARESWVVDEGKRMGGKFEESAALIATTKAGDGKLQRPEGSVAGKVDEDLDEEEAMNEVQSYSLAACQAVVHSSVDYKVVIVREDGTAGHCAHDTKVNKEGACEGGAVGCLPTGL